MSIPSSRRDFFRNLLLAGVSGAFAPTLLATLAEAADPELVDMTGTKRKDPQNTACVAAAKNVKYHDSIAGLDKEYKAGKIGKPNSFKDKAGKEIPFLERTCDKCALFGMAGKPGTCPLVAGCLVAAKGSCASWSPKPA